jgi:hypothetical protein
LSTKITKSIILLLMAVLLVSSLGYVKFSMANPAPLGYPYPQLYWGCANNATFTNNNVNIDFNINFSSDTLITYGWGGLQPNYTVTTDISGIKCMLDWEKGDKSVPVTKSASGTYFVNLTGLAEGKHNIRLELTCGYNYSEQFNQDIKDWDSESLSHITNSLPALFWLYFNVQTNQESSLIIASGVGISLAVIVAVALVIIYRKSKIKKIT